MRLGTGKTSIFGGRLRLSRKAKRWTRTDLERRTGIKVSMIREYEEGRCLPSAPRLILLAKALDVDPAWLVPVEKEDGK
jgi:transcriptional regulator with XRE-family HTH domain